MLKHILKYALAILVLSIFPSSLIALTPVVVSSENKNYLLGKDIETMEDREGKLSISDVSSPAMEKNFIRSGKLIPNFGFTNSIYWSRIRLVNKSSIQKDWLLEIGFPLLDRVILFKPDGTAVSGTRQKWKIFETGRLFPFNQREEKHRNFVFNIELIQNKTTDLYMRIQTQDGMIFPMTLRNPDEFKIHIQSEQFIFGIYYGFVIVMILYNLFLFISIRDRNYMCYILYILFFGLFLLAMNGLAFQHLWPDSPWWAIHANPFFIGLSLFFGIRFSMRFLDTKNVMPIADKTFIVLMVLSGLLSVSSFFVSYSITIIAGQILPLASIVIVIPVAFYSLYNGYKSARYYLIAWMVLLIGVVLSNLRVMGLIDHNIITEHGLQIGSCVDMVLLSLALADRINIMKEEKEKAQAMVIESQNREFLSLKTAKETVEDANIKISISEEKYRRIVEGTSDFIFSLDEDNRFLNANRTSIHYFGIKPDNLKSTSFFDLIYDNTDANVLKLIVREKFELLKKSKGQVEFRAEFKTENIIEPIEMLVRLEYINIEGNNEILGKASNVIHDELGNYLISENQKYSIGNYFLTVEEIAHKMTNNLKKHIDIKKVNVIRLGLREMILNAIEHGNLGISFQDKSEALMNNNYFEFVNSRRLDPVYRDRKVMIDYTMDDDKARYLIIDEGEGFDHEKLFNDEINHEEEDLSHGRGIRISRNIFDEIKYNKTGNQVLLVKYFKSEITAF